MAKHIWLAATSCESQIVIIQEKEPWPARLAKKARHWLDVIPLVSSAKTMLAARARRKVEGIKEQVGGFVNSQGGERNLPEALHRGLAHLGRRQKRIIWDHVNIEADARFARLVRILIGLNPKLGFEFNAGSGKWRLSKAVLERGNLEQTKKRLDEFMEYFGKVGQVYIAMYKKSRKGSHDLNNLLGHIDLLVQVEKRNIQREQKTAE
ncbi:hypothetical protein FJZ26_00145 [Candidatus Parvarchaeota archaeon]|nr:hypothetical protein [Candidatus Parvarchaeota archaeon]